jgi:hypothetical protein
MVGTLFGRVALADFVAMEDALFYRSSKTLNNCVHIWRKDILGSRSRRSATTCERRRAQRRSGRLAIGSND